MKPDIFMSYSRREVGFVDDLTHRLEKVGFKVWLDYRSLIPGTPWAGQIAKGLDESEIILLVVSQSSIASQYVELEWRRVLNENKRIILAIFEAVDLPPELEKFEWVDFRGNYEKGMNELVSQLQSPIQEEHPAPETGFKMPIVVWVSAVISVMAAFLSLITFWTIILPWVLVPLPYRIFKRNFNYVQVQAALWMFIIASVVLTAGFADTLLFKEIESVYDNLHIFLFLVPITLIFLLRSKGMQRWGKPEATSPQFANIYKPNNPNPKSVSFFIDHAAQDRRVSNELTKVLSKYGHLQVVDIKSAEAVFVLISTYKTDSEADPERQVVFPVLVQAVMPVEKLSKIQWIDFSHGVRNLDAIAQLLPDPAKLLSALGMRPIGNQLSLPPIINYIIFFLVLSGVLTFGSVVLDAFYNAILGFDNYNVAGLIFFALLLCGFAAMLVRALVTRRGWLASPAGLLLGSFVIIYLSANSWWPLGTIEFMDSGASFMSLIVGITFIPLGVTLGMLALLFFRRSILLWFPV